MQKSISHDDLLKEIVKQEKTSLEFGFYWESAEQILKQIESEAAEIREPLTRNNLSHLKEELGDLIYASICLCIYLNLDPTEILKDNIEKYQKRYDKLVHFVKQDGLDNLKGKSMDVLLSYWDKAKKAEI